MNKKLITDFIDTFKKDFNFNDVKKFIKNNKIESETGDDIFNLIADELKNYSDELIPNKYHSAKEYRKNVSDFKTLKKSLKEISSNDLFNEESLLENTLKKDVLGNSSIENLTEEINKINNKHINSLEKGTKKSRTSSKTRKEKIDLAIDKSLENFVTDEMGENEISQIKEILSNITDENTEKFYDNFYKSKREKYKDLNEQDFKDKMSKYMKDENYHNADIKYKAKKIEERELKEEAEKIAKEKAKKKTRKEKKTIKKEKKLTKEIASESGSKLSLGTALTYGVAAWSGISTYKDAKENGDNTLVAGAKGLFEATVAQAVPMPIFLSTQLIPLVPKASIKGLSAMQRYQREMSRQQRNTPFVNNKFVDHSGAVTMRQAGMQLAEASRYNLQQSMLGNEAQSLKR